MEPINQILPVHNYSNSSPNPSGISINLIISLALDIFSFLIQFAKSVCDPFTKKMMGPRKIEKVVILGSGAAGSAAAVFAAQAHLNPLVIQDNDCKAQMALIHKIDNYPGVVEEIEGVDLLNLFRKQATEYGARFHENSVVKVDLQNRPFKIELSDGQSIDAESLIVATGTAKRWLGIPNEQTLRGRGVVAATFCSETDFKDKEILVIGGGHAALQEAQFLSGVAKKVTLINRDSTFTASKFHQEQVLKNKKVEIVYNTEVEEILEAKGVFNAVVLKNRQTNQIYQRSGEILLVAIGNRPNSDLFKGQLDLSSKGHIVIHGKNSSTNIPGVFAAGDVSDVSYGRVVIAAGSGAMAGLDAVRYLDDKR